MPYTFNPHRHVKIWLSTNPDTFLNLENQLRLIRMREINPGDSISFVYSEKLLKDHALESLRVKLVDTHLKCDSLLIR